MADGRVGRLASYPVTAALQGTSALASPAGGREGLLARADRKGAGSTLSRAASEPSESTLSRAATLDSAHGQSRPRRGCPAGHVPAESSKQLREQAACRRV